MEYRTLRHEQETGKIHDIDGLFRAIQRIRGLWLLLPPQGCVKYAYVGTVPYGDGGFDSGVSP